MEASQVDCPYSEICNLWRSSLPLIAVSVYPGIDISTICRYIEAQTDSFPGQKVEYIQ